MDKTQGHPVIMYDGTTTTVKQGHPVTVLGYVDEAGNFIPGFPSGGGGGGFKIYNTTAELLAVTGTEVGESVGNLETGTFWKWDGTTWVDTTTPIYATKTTQDIETVDAAAESVGGTAATQREVNNENATLLKEMTPILYDNKSIEVVRQKVLTDSELIELFGITTTENYTIEVDASSVVWGVIGTYNVTFKAVNAGLSDVLKPLTLQVVIVPRLLFNIDDIEKYTIETSEADIASDFTLKSNLSDLTIDNPTGISPTVTAITDPTNGTGTRYEFIGQDPSILKQIVGNFNNVVTLTNAENLGIVMEGVDYVVHSNNPFNQKWGFEVFDNGAFNLLQSGFIYTSVKMTYKRQVSDKLIDIDSIVKFTNLQAGKLIAKPMHAPSELVVNDPTWLKADIKEDSSGVLNLAVSRTAYNEADNEADELKAAIKKNRSSTLVFSWGKNWTGSINTDYTARNYEVIPIDIFFKEEAESGNKYLYKEFALEALPPLPLDGLPNPGEEIATFSAEELDGEYLYSLFGSIKTDEGPGTDLGFYGAITIGGIIYWDGLFSTSTDTEKVTPFIVPERFKSSPLGSNISRDIRIYAYKLGDSTATVLGGGVRLE